MSVSINIPDLLRLASIPGIGAYRIRSLITHFSSAKEVLQASPRNLVRVEGIDKKLASFIAHYKDGESFVEEQLSRLNKVNGRIITLWDEDYPPLLKKIYDPPVILFVRGMIKKDDQYSVAIVGTRNPTQYGKLAAEKFAKELSTKGVCIISGLARGVDTIAHTAALQSGGRTVSVIGSSLDHIYPAENKKLVDQIEEQDRGAVVSEFFMDTKPDPGNFPRRNRIISGMSFGTLIIESDLNGGAMITATTAIDQNRELFCLPGNISEKKSSGTNKLIKLGEAKLVQTVDDILDELEISLRPILTPRKQKNSPPALTIFEQKIFDVLSEEPMHIDLISEQSGLLPSDTLVNLLSIEFKSLVRQLPGKFFVKI
ncbi:MAG: DNA-processing protein DprA [Bacteroidota bacterium]|nr:DNA-processing protein DprA [Bacteroidota bacterium]